ncbi:MAG: hypothetical protein QOE63_792 [Acidimicrobiaceae bacterium]
MLRLYVQLIGAVVALHVAFSLAGLPAVLLWRSEARSVRVATAPVAGLAILGTLSWYWGTLGIGGVAAMARPAVVVLAAIGLGLLARGGIDRDRVRRLLADAWFPLAAWLGGLLIVLVMVTPMLHVGLLTSTALSNNDVASYALNAQNLADHPLTQHSTLDNDDLSHFTKIDVFGSITALSLSDGLLGVDVWRLTTPALAMVWLDVCVLLAVLARARLRLRPVPAIGAALVASSSWIFVFVAFNYFFSQLIGVTFVLTALLVFTGPAFAAASPSRRHLIEATAALTVAMVGMLLAYPPFIFLQLPVIVVMVVVARMLRLRSWRAFLTPALVTGAALAVAVALIPTRVAAMSERLSDQATGDYGFPIRGFTPFSLIGLQPRFPGNLQGWVLVATAALLLAVAAATVLALVRRAPFAAEAAVFFTVIPAGYVWLVHSKGPSSYSSWTWLAYSQPLLVVVMIAMVLFAVRALPPRGTDRAVRTDLGTLALGILLTVVAANGRLALDGFDARPDHFPEPVSPGALVVDGPLFDLGTNPAISALDSINVNVYQYWETMWAAYFVRRVPHVHMISMSYFRNTAPLSGWTLQRADLTPEVPGVHRIVVNDRYVLVDVASAPVDH